MTVYFPVQNCRSYDLAEKKHKLWKILIATKLCRWQISTNCPIPLFSYVLLFYILFYHYIYTKYMICCLYDICNFICKLYVRTSDFVGKPDKFCGKLVPLHQWNPVLTLLTLLSPKPSNEIWGKCIHFFFTVFGNSAVL